MPVNADLGMTDGAPAGSPVAVRACMPVRWAQVRESAVRCSLAPVGEYVAGLLRLGMDVETRCAPSSPACSGVHPRWTWALRHGRGSPLGGSGHGRQCVVEPRGGGGLPLGPPRCAPGCVWVYVPRLRPLCVGGLDRPALCIVEQRAGERWALFGRRCGSLGESTCTRGFGSVHNGRGEEAR